MARTRVLHECSLKSWDDADEALRRIGQIDRDVTKSETKMNERIDAEKKKYKTESDPLLAEKKVLEKDLEQFCVGHRDDFFGEKSKKLVFGTVNFRKASGLVTKKAAQIIESIKRVFGDKANQYLSYGKPKLDKKSLATLSDDKLSEIGVSRAGGETFGYEVDQAKLDES